MKNFEEHISNGGVHLGGLILENTTKTPIITAKTELYVPEKKIILLDQASEQERQFLMGITENKGGLIV